MGRSSNHAEAVRTNSPSCAIPGRIPVDPIQAKEWFRATFGEMPAPTADMDALSDESQGDRGSETRAILERSVPEVYKWARFDAPELAQRVGSAAARAQSEGIWKQPKLVFTGAAGAGKTSLAVACLRQWAAQSGKTAVFIHAYALGIARLQHAAGHGEPEIVERAMRYPMVLVDDVGSEREMAGNALPDVIFVRHAENHPLWVTTGLTRAQLVARYGTGIVRRLLERATLIQVGPPKSKL
jgi:DNA replication protein DnaC